jgi:arabinogalactan endo-1,4-beta-galactosidase
MKTIDKIESYLKKMDEKYQKNIMNKELMFLYKTEDLDEIGLESEVKDRLLEAKKGGKEYDDFFKGMLKKYKVKSYKDLPKDKQKKFFDEVDKAWKAKKETD